MYNSGYWWSMVYSGKFFMISFLHLILQIDRHCKHASFFFFRFWLSSRRKTRQSLYLDPLLRAGKMPSASPSRTWSFAAYALRCWKSQSFWDVGTLFAFTAYSSTRQTNPGRCIALNAGKTQTCPTAWMVCLLILGPWLWRTCLEALLLIQKILPPPLPLKLSPLSF